MKAVVYSDVHDMSVQDIDEPKIDKPTDAILRITTTAICGSDLHMYEGRTSMEKGRSLGHEIMGIIESVGDAVQQIKKGDRVVLPFNIACGSCYNCTRGYTSACLTMNPENAGAGYGYAGQGPYQGGQAEYIRVPYADFNCLKLPGKEQDELEDDFILLADIFPTAYHATELAMVKPGSTVAIFGAGPVGLLAAHCSILKGASEVYVVDFHTSRLAKAEEFGATPININNGDPVEQIMKIRKNNALLKGSLRDGEEKMMGVMCGIDAIGYQSRDDNDYDTEKPTQVIENLVKLVNPTGAIGLIGVYLMPDPGAEDAKKKLGIFEIPVAAIFNKGLTVGGGQCPVKKYDRMLLDMIISGKAKPSKIVSHRIKIEDAPEAYKKFDDRVEGYTKILIKN
jgi:glutathione-independent formaldehyde dehydrogenase